MAKNHEQLIFENWLAPSWGFFGLKMEKRNFFVIFPQKRPFLGGGGFLFCFIQTLLFQRLYLRFNNKKIIFYYIGNDFLQFSMGWSKNTKIVLLLNFGRLPVCEFSLDLKKNLIWATLNYIYKISLLMAGPLKKIIIYCGFPKGNIIKFRFMKNYKRG